MHGELLSQAVREPGRQTTCANAFRTNGTAEEVILDFGLSRPKAAGGFYREGRARYRSTRFFLPEAPRAKFPNKLRCPLRGRSAQGELFGCGQPPGKKAAQGDIGNAIF